MPETTGETFPPLEDIRENELLLQHGFRLLSAYRASAVDSLGAIAEAGRSSAVFWRPENIDVARPSAKNEP